MQSAPHRRDDSMRVVWWRRWRTHWHTTVSTVKSTITVTVPLLETDRTLVSLAPTGNHGGLPPGAATQHKPEFPKQVALLARTMPPPTCHVMLSLGTGQTRSDCVWHRCWAMWWLLKKRPASTSFLISWVQYRLISSKELIYGQQLHSFNSPSYNLK